MNTWKQYIEQLNANLTGRKVIYPASLGLDGKVYTVVGVDYNGCLLVDLPSEHNETTAINDDYWLIDKKDEDSDPYRAFRPTKEKPVSHLVPEAYRNEQ